MLFSLRDLTVGPGLWTMGFNGYETWQFLCQGRAEWCSVTFPSGSEPLLLGILISMGLAYLKDHLSSRTCFNICLDSPPSCLRGTTAVNASEDFLCSHTHAMELPPTGGTCHPLTAFCCQVRTSGRGEAFEDRIWGSIILNQPWIGWQTVEPFKCP